MIDICCKTLERVFNNYIIVINSYDNISDKMREYSAFDYECRGMKHIIIALQVSKGDLLTFETEVNVLRSKLLELIK